MLEKFASRPLTIPTAAIMDKEGQINSRFMSNYSEQMAPRFENANRRALAIKSQVLALQEEFDDPLSFAQYGDEEAQ